MEHHHRLCVVGSVVDERDPPRAVQGGHDAQTPAPALVAQHRLGRRGHRHQLAGLDQADTV